MVKLGQLYHCVTQSTVTLSSSPFPELPETLVWGACKDLGWGMLFYTSIYGWWGYGNIKLCSLGTLYKRCKV